MRIRRIGLGCIGLAASCAVAERLFFNGMDENGMLRESFFLPLAWGFGIVGGVLVAGAGVAALRSKPDPRTR